jgi:hypothetical protein
LAGASPPFPSPPPPKTLLLSPADRRDVVATQLPLSSKGTWLRAGAGAECDIGVANGTRVTDWGACVAQESSVEMHHIITMSGYHGGYAAQPRSTPEPVAGSTQKAK